MNADTEATIDIVFVKKPPSVDQQQVEVVYCWGLHYPIHPTGLILKMKDKGKRRREMKKEFSFFFFCIFIKPMENLQVRSLLWHGQSRVNSQTRADNLKIIHQCMLMVGLEALCSTAYITANILFLESSSDAAAKYRSLGQVWHGDAFKLVEEMRFTTSHP